MKKLIYILATIVLTVLPLTSRAVEGRVTSDTLLVNAMRADEVSFSHGNTIKLLTSGQKKFDDMFETIRNARQSIHLEYFNFRNDSIAMLLFDLLAEKAKQGVEVRALFDDFGNKSNNQPLKDYHLKALHERGIQIYTFDPIKFPWVNHIFGRDHRKIVVIDGKVAYTGGMNVADYYINGTKQVGEWRDMHCRLEGPEVNTLQEIFLAAWLKITGETITDKKYFQAKPTSEDMMAGIVNREPHLSPKAVRQFYKHAIDCAQDTIRIINPYFTLIPSIKRAIRDAARRGVNVQIMLSEPCDEPVTPDVGYYNAEQLRKEGCQIWIYKPGFHHTKVIMVDGRYCTVGSTNLDQRSLKCDYEENVVIVNSKITKQLDRIFDCDKEKSFAMTEGVYNQWRTPWQRFRAKIYYHLLRIFL